jgi:proline dehydrogenase
MRFDDTSVAFSDRTDAEVRRAKWLFTLVGSPTLVKMGSPLLNLALRLHLPVKGLIRSTVFSHFCGGEDIPSCSVTVDRLYRSHIHSLLDFSAEGKDTEDDHDRVMREVMLTIHNAADDRRIPFAVFKCTGLVRFGLLEKLSGGGPLTQEEKTEWSRARGRVVRLCEEAARCNVPIFIDAEESWIQDAIDLLAHEMMALHNRQKAIVHNTVQLYRNDRLQHLYKAHATAKNEGYIYGVKLVRGAYMEKERERAAKHGYPSPIHVDKASTDRDFDQAVEHCLAHVSEISVFIGTHNENSCETASGRLLSLGKRPDERHVWFGQLLGMSDNISYALAQAGHNVVKYVPYGPVADVMPYLIRRAEENTSIAGQTGRELSLIRREIERRKTRTA